MNTNRVRAATVTMAAVLIVGAVSPIARQVDKAKAADYLAEFDAACVRVGDRVWGLSLCGPTLIVDPASREVVTNQRDPLGALTPSEWTFTGTLPDDIPVANTAMEWSGRRWTMLMWGSLQSDSRARLRLMGHEAFHRIQPDLGFTGSGDLNAHLDTEDGRYWLQLEWNALERALTSRGETSRRAIADAVLFRSTRRARFAEAASRENALEVFEGLAEYTGMRFVEYSQLELLKTIASVRGSDRSFIRSFAYASGPLYGFLLDRESTAWRTGLRADDDLGARLAQLARALPEPGTDATTRANEYDGVAILEKEKGRTEQQRARLREWRRTLVEGAVLVLDLSSVTSAAFDPYGVFPFGEKQTVYTTRTLAGAWGTLGVTRGAILEDGSRRLGYVSLEGAAADSRSGNGWTLTLNKGWDVVRGDRAGDMKLRPPD